ncbi:MAG: Crp/Fnr family transcriptional regulator [Desulfobacterota bacterium]|nr:Crp/Fnr family transcriptional regulator [Thermodesulfobacteriota bacterium]
MQNKPQITPESASANVVIREHSAGDVIVATGHPCDRFYVVLQGAVEILGEGIRVRLLTTGDLFGIEYVFLQQPYTISAVAMTAARVASYAPNVLHELLMKRPQLMHQVLKSISRQLEQTVQTVIKQATGAYRDATRTFPQNSLEVADDGIAIRITENLADEPNFHDDVLTYFIEESRELLEDLQKIGESLKLVGIPNQREAVKLREFAQKLNRLIGGTASMGFEQFTQLSRKTSLLATRCAEIHDLSIRIVISNLNLVVATLMQCFANLDAIKEAEHMIPLLEQRLDICMTAVGIPAPDIKTQKEIDEILMNMRKSTSSLS